MESETMRQETSQALDALVQVIATAVAERVMERLAPAQTAPRYATAKHNPLGSAAAFRKAAAAGAFETFKQGKATAAMWSDVEAFMRSRQAPARQRRSGAGELSMTDMLRQAAAPMRSRRTA